MQKFSKNYKKSIKALKKIGETNTNIIYQIKSLVKEDLCLKVPKKTGKKGFHDLIYET